MAGPPRRQQHFEVEEDIRPLTGTGSSHAARRRHLGPTGYVDALSSALRGKGAVILAILTIGAVYMVGKEKGQSLRFGPSLSEVDGKNPVSAPSVPTLNTAAEPTYEPTGEFGLLLLLNYNCD
jgi:hypothetical protein